MKKNILFLLCLVVALLVSCNSDGTGDDNCLALSELIVSVGDSKDEIDFSLKFAHVSKLEVKDELIDLEDEVRRTFIKEYTIGDVEDGILAHDAKYYGKHRITLTIYTAGENVFSLSREVALTADEYNAACLIATVPATDFTLIALDGDGKTEYFNPEFPTIITLERAQAYNWDNLPESMMICPFMSDDKVRNGYLADGWSLDYPEFWEYVNYLYQLDNDSKFNFYLNDYWPDHIFNAFSAGIPLSQMTITFVTDGTASFLIIRDTYKDGGEGDDSLEIYGKYQASWEKVKAKLNAGDLTGYKNELIASTDSQILRPYLPVLINDSGIKVWWIVNNTSENNFGSSEVFKQKVAKSSNFKSVNMNTLLNNLNEEEQKELRYLYSFDNTELVNAQKEGKKILVFLGTSTSGEGSLEDAIKIMKAIYGDEYAYFYKGHPGHVMNDDGRRERIAKDNGVTIIDASVPAELVYFFNPTIGMCGYQSSTFANLTDLQVSYIFFPGEKTELAYNDRIESFSTFTEGKYTIIRNALAENISHAFWTPAKDINTITWIEGAVPEKE